MTTDERIAEIKFKVDHRKLHPQDVHAAFYFLLSEIERLTAELWALVGKRPVKEPPATQPLEDMANPPNRKHA